MFLDSEHMDHRRAKHHYGIPQRISLDLYKSSGSQYNGRLFFTRSRDVTPSFKRSTFDYFVWTPGDLTRVKGSYGHKRC